MKLFHMLTTVLLLVNQVNCNAFQNSPIGSISSFNKLSGKKLPTSLPDQSILNNHGHVNPLPKRGGGSAKYALPVVSFGDTPFKASTVIFAATNALGFVISIFTGSHVHLDLLGTGAFTLASIPGLLAPSSLRVFLSSGAVAIWGTKLASFLFFRALKVKHDVRLDGTLSTTSGAATFWVISFLWGIICSLPHTLGTTSTSAGNPITLAIGSTVYLLGLATESKADYQKWIFKKQNPGKFCNEGLWSVSQHPNFFGNLLLWAGIYIMNIDSFIQPVNEGNSILSALSGSWKAWVALLSPLFMWSLFYGQSSGAIMTSVEMANKKYGSDVTYIEYVKNVPLIIPRIFNWLKSLLS